MAKTWHLALVLALAALFTGCGGTKKAQPIDLTVCREGLTSTAPGVSGDLDQDNDMNFIVSQYGMVNWGGWGKSWHMPHHPEVIRQRFWMFDGHRFQRFLATCYGKNDAYFDGAGPD